MRAWLRLGHWWGQKVSIWIVVILVRPEVCFVYIFFLYPNLMIPYSKIDFRKYVALCNSSRRSSIMGLETCFLWSENWPIRLAMRKGCDWEDEWLVQHLLYLFLYLIFLVEQISIRIYVHCGILVSQWDDVIKNSYWRQLSFFKEVLILVNLCSKCLVGDLWCLYLLFNFHHQKYGSTFNFLLLLRSYAGVLEIQTPKSYVGVELLQPINFVIFFW